jgi:hypothetical protein
MTNLTANTVGTESGVTLCACNNFTFVNFGDDEKAPQCRMGTKRTFAPGHDAKLKGELIRRGIAGDLVRLASGELVSPESVAYQFGFGHLVTEGIRRGIEKAQAKAEKKAAKGKTAERKLAEDAGIVTADQEPAPVEVPEVVKAKIGRWTYEGTVDNGEFTFTDKKGRVQTVRKFKLV